MVLIIAWHFLKSRHSGFDLGHQIELGAGPIDACLAVVGLGLAGRLKRSRRRW
jgi:hypothetical protein